MSYLNKVIKNQGEQSPKDFLRARSSLLVKSSAKEGEVDVSQPYESILQTDVSDLTKELSELRVEECAQKGSFFSLHSSS